MSLKHGLLGVLAARPMNGYSLARFFEASQNWIWSARQSQIYGTLKKLEQTGLIQARRDSGKNGLDTNVFSLTDAGRAELTEWIGSSHPAAATRDGFALQALYFDEVSVESARAVLGAYIAQQTELLADWERHRDALARGDTPLLRERFATRPASAHRKMARLKAHVFDGQVRQARVRIAWAREAQRLVDED